MKGQARGDNQNENDNDLKIFISRITKARKKGLCGSSQT
jgi:hypothetical protein